MVCWWCLSIPASFVSWITSNALINLVANFCKYSDFCVWWLEGDAVFSQRHACLELDGKPFVCHAEANPVAKHLGTLSQHCSAAAHTKYKQSTLKTATNNVTKSHTRANFGSLIIINRGPTSVKYCFYWLSSVHLIQHFVKDTWGLNWFFLSC